jgi:UDP-N-acetylglucosamine 2-epimerase (non-hydrolysing)
MTKILLIFGTRPEIIKLAPVINALKAKRSTELLLGHSGQHYDLAMSQVFIRELGLPNPDFNLSSGSGSHAMQTGKILVGCEKAIKRFDPDVVVAEGDTNTVVAVALAATKVQVPFAHVESGLRSFDRRMPEEINRTLADHCADLCFAPTEMSATNLLREAIPPRRITVTGNTIVDSCLKYLPLARRLSTIEGVIEDRKDKFCLLTIHRAENVDSKETLAHLVTLLCKLRENIICPVHPRTRLRLREYGYWKLLQKQEHITLLPPLGYWDFLRLLSNCRFVMTDSGGVQEEALTLGVPCITLRENTERPETVIAGYNFVTGLSMVNVTAALKKAEQLPRSPIRKNPLGDGQAGKRIAALLTKGNIKSGAQHPGHLLDGYATRYLIARTNVRQAAKLRRLITLSYDASGRISFPRKPADMNGWSVELFGEPSTLRPHIRRTNR